MRLVPFADDDKLCQFGTRRILGAPSGDLLDDRVRPAEVILVHEFGRQDSTLVKVGFEPGDLDRIVETGEMFILFDGHGMLPTSILHRHEI